MKINHVLIALILISFSLIYTAKAAGITAAGVFEVPNVLPIVKISAYGDENFRNIKSYADKGDDVFVKIEIEDANGKDDISSVNVKIVKLEFDSERVISDYNAAAFAEGSGNKAIYEHSFNAGEGGRYKVYVMVKDGKDQLVQTLELDSRENNPAITGAAVLENNAIIIFFKKIFRDIINLF